ncbi:MAG: 4-alpha-glucanotransferase [Planctomycetota bacterium]
MTKSRASGILLHITSLPSKYGVGDLGPAAYKFAEFLARAKQTCWQMLPLTPPTLKKNPYSPYNCLSAFAGNTLLISPELLYRDGLLRKKDLNSKPRFPEAWVDYSSVLPYKTKLLNLAFERFKSMSPAPDYDVFCSQNNHWLEDYAAFIVLRRRFRRRLWCDWPPEFKSRKEQTPKHLKACPRDAICREIFLQYVFFRQWSCLKRHCNRLGIRIIGDIPIYVAYDSADLWAHPETFDLTRAGTPRVVAGVPPDLFSRTGQLWGNPVYDWAALKKQGYRWWLKRIEHNLAMFDIVRLDHFRGFVACWQVPAGSKTAVDGTWVDGPKEDFLSLLFERFPASRFIAEDLGYITPDVTALIDKFQLASMKILLFAFDAKPDPNPHAPNNHTENSVVYTGTHDNNTVKGWFCKEAPPQTRKRIFASFGKRVPLTRIHWEFIRLAMSSVARMAIIPMQDILGLGQEARMNRPATIKGNWSWRLRTRQIKTSTINNLADLTKASDRA